jgi:hypothetical protein
MGRTGRRNKFTNLGTICLWVFAVSGGIFSSEGIRLRAVYRLKRLCGLQHGREN